MCCYTQYFAAVGAVVIYIIIGLFLLIYQRKNIWKLFVSGIAVVVGYAPWIGVLFKQISAVESDKNTIHVAHNTVSDYIDYFITDRYSYHTRFFILLLFIILLILAANIIINRMITRSSNVFDSSFIGIIAFAAITLFGLIASMIGNPILLPRYLFMSLLSLLFGIGTIFSESGVRIKRCVSIILVALIMMQGGFFCLASSKKARDCKEWRDLLVSGNDSIIYVESTDFSGRIIRQITNCRVIPFVEKEYSSEYDSVMKKYKASTVELFDEVVYGEDYAIIESNDGEYLINEVKAKDSILVALKHPEITKYIERHGMIAVEKIGENGNDLLYRFTYLPQREEN